MSLQTNFKALRVGLKLQAIAEQAQTAQADGRFTTEEQLAIACAIAQLLNTEYDIELPMYPLGDRGLSFSNVLNSGQVEIDSVFSILKSLT